MPKFTVKEIQEWDVSTDLGDPSAKTYVPCRPLDGPFLWRLKAAWGVLTGKYDALDWGPGQRGVGEERPDNHDHIDSQDSWLSKGQG